MPEPVVATVILLNLEFRDGIDPPQLILGSASLAAEIQAVVKPDRSASAALFSCGRRVGR
jgi:hypothetical protein